MMMMMMMIMSRTMMTITVMMRKMMLVVVMTVNWYQFYIRGVCPIARGDGRWVLGSEK